MAKPSKGLLNLLGIEDQETQDQQPIISEGPAASTEDYFPAREPASEEVVPEVVEPTPVAEVEPKKEKSYEEKLLEQIANIRTQGKEDVTAAKKDDRKRALYANLFKALGNIGAAEVQRKVGTDVGLTPFTPAKVENTAKDVMADRRADIQSLLDEYKIKKALEPKKLTDYQQKNLDLQQRRLDLMEGKEGRLTKKDALQKEVKGRLSDKEVKEITQLDDGMRILDDIEDMYKNTDVTEDLGPYAARAEEYSRYIPFAERDEDFVKIQQLVGIQLADYVKSISGAQVSEQEAQRLLKNIPNMTDKPKAFKVKLDQFRKELEGARADYLENIGKQKESAEKFKRSETSSKDEMVSIGNKEYRVGSNIKAKGKLYRIKDSQGNLEEVK